MQIKSRPDGDSLVCEYQPRPEQCAGPTQFVYGGTIASLIDCHSIGTALANYYRRDGFDVGDGPAIWCVTGRIEVDYLKPTPIDRPIQLRAWLDAVGDRKSVVLSEVRSGDDITARGRVIAIRVPPDWRDGA